MYNLEEIVEIMDRMLDTNSKRHITGGVLLSLSVLFGGLALTIMTMKGDDRRE